MHTYNHSFQITVVRFISAPNNGHYLRWQDSLYLNYILKISKYEIDMRGKSKNAQYMLKETHTAMIMTREPSLPSGITPQEVV